MRSERGVIIPAAAILFLTLVGLLVFLGIRPVLIKSASLDLKRELENTCAEIAHEPWIQADVISAFEEYVQKWNIGRYAKVTQAAIVVPNIRKTNTDAHAQPSQNMNCIDIDGDTIPSCTYYGDPSLYASEQKLPLGDDFWHVTTDTLGNDRLMNEGNTIVCEAEADFIDSGLFGLFRSGVSSEKQIQASKVSARVAYWRPPRNWNMGATTELSADKFRSRGLSIIIAPHMSTFVESPRFLFNEAGHANFDPLRTSGTDVLSAKFALPAPPANVSNNNTYFQFQVFNGNPPERLPTYDMMRIKPPLATEWRGINTGGTPPLSDKHQLLASCMNPAVLARNIFVSTIVGLASRSAHFRWNTDIYIAGTQHQVRDGLDSDNNNSYFPNPPIQMVARGTDITEKQYQLPYISFYNGLEDGSAEFTPDSKPNADDNNYEYPRLGNRRSTTEGRRGWILPFYNPGNQPSKYIDTGSSTLDEQISSIKAYISGQLRYCYHLYSGSVNNGLDLDAAAQIVGYRPNTTNTNFEPIEYQPRTDFQGKIRQWDQVFGSGANGPWDTPGVPFDGVSAEELTSIIGTIQMCPFEMGFPNSADSHFPNTSIGGSDSFCSKPPGFASTFTGSVAPHDLRPDLIAAFSALGGSAVANYQLPMGSPISGATTKIGAVRSPGIFPFNTQASAPFSYTIPTTSSGTTDNNERSVMHVFDDSAYDLNVDAASNVYLLITHQPITVDEAAAIKPLIQNSFTGATPIRPVILVYMPINNSDAHPDAKSRFLNILGLSTGDDWGEGINQYIEISPFTKRYIIEGTDPVEFVFGDDALTPEETLYKNFWNFLLAPQDDYENSVKLGKSVFKQNIVTLEALL